VEDILPVDVSTSKDPQSSPRTSKDPQSSPRTFKDPQSSPRLSIDPQSSPRKQKEKVVEPESETDINEIVKLNRLSVEEKQMIKNLVKLTKSKNKTLDNLEESFRRERQTMASQFESEKAAMVVELHRAQQELAEKNTVLRNEEAKSSELKNKLRNAQSDLHEAQATVATYKRVLADYKRNTDTELFNKSQTLLHMDKKLGALSKLRESMECVICEEHVAKIILNPCHHLVLCPQCSPLVTQCPMCRSPVVSRYEIYSNWVL